MIVHSIWSVTYERWYVKELTKIYKKQPAGLTLCQSCRAFRLIC